MNEDIAVYGPLIEGEEMAASAESLRRGWLGMGRDVDAFEQGVTDALGLVDRQVGAVGTGFVGLHVGVLVAGVGEGDEVIVPPLTHLADIQAIVATGAEPVLCDVDEATLCIDPEAAAALVGGRTKAIVALDYGCHLYDDAALARLAAEHGLRIVHDAAHAFGSTSAGRRVGTFSDICVFSFDPVKALTAIDAGVLVLSDAREVRHAREIRLLGSNQPAEVMYMNARTGDYDARRPGYRYHLSNIHAAIGVAQLAKLGSITANRQRACHVYQQMLKGVDHVRIPDADIDDLNPFLYYVRVAADERDGLRAALAAQGIGTGIHWRPAHHHTMFRRFRRGPLDVTDAAAAELVTLPLHSSPCEDVAQRVSDAIIGYFR